MMNLNNKETYILNILIYIPKCMDMLLNVISSLTLNQKIIYLEKKVIFIKYGFKSITLFHTKKKKKM